MTNVNLTRDDIETIAKGNPRIQRFIEKTAETIERFDTTNTSFDCTNVASAGIGNIPDWVREVTITMSSVGFVDAADALIQIGGYDASGAGFFYTTGYFATCALIDGAAVSTADYSTGFGIKHGDATKNIMGSMRLNRFRNGGNYRWCASYAFRAGNGRVSVGGGRIIIADELQQIRVISSTGGLMDEGLIAFAYTR